MDGKRPKITRRTFIIDREFQLKYTLLLVGVGILISAVFGTMMYVVHMDSLKVLADGGGMEAMAKGGSTLLWLVGGVTVMMAAALSMAGLVITHRVAGPVYVMTHYMNQLADGRYPVMRKLRRNDELKNLFENVQGAIESMRSREQQEADKLGDALAKLSPLASSADSKALIADLRAIYDRKRTAIESPAGPRAE